MCWISRMIIWCISIYNPSKISCNHPIYSKYTQPTLVKFVQLNFTGYTASIHLTTPRFTRSRLMNATYRKRHETKCQKQSKLEPFWWNPPPSSPPVPGGLVWSGLVWLSQLFTTVSFFMKDVLFLNKEYLEEFHRKMLQMPKSNFLSFARIKHTPFTTCSLWSGLVWPSSSSTILEICR
jgi:hypothetical protein